MLSREKAAVLRIKSVKAPINHRKDGLRIHTARTRGRGLSSRRYDVWMANLGPSQRLLKRYQKGDMTWAAYRVAYKLELLECGPVDARCKKNFRNKGQKFTLRLIKKLAKGKPVTLMCTCEDLSTCHISVLRDLIRSKQI